MNKCCKCGAEATQTLRLPGEDRKFYCDKHGEEVSKREFALNQQRNK